MAKNMPKSKQTHGTSYKWLIGKLKKIEERSKKPPKKLTFREWLFTPSGPLD